MYDNTQPQAYQPSPAAPSGSGKGKIIAIVIALLIFCCVVVLVVSGIIFLMNRNDDSNPTNNNNSNNNNSSNSPVPTATVVPTNPPVANGYEVYTNSTYQFSFVLPEDWTVSPSSKQFNFKDENGEAKIQLLVQDASEYTTGNIEINVAFCTGFSSTFSQKLIENGATGSIDITYFTLNGMPGCQGRAEVIDGVYQRYYVFYNEDTNSIYFMFYTTIDPVREEPKLKEILDSFEFID